MGLFKNTGRKFLLLAIFLIPALAQSLPLAEREAAVAPEVMDLHRSLLVCDLHADTQALIWIYGYDMKKRHFSVDWGPAGWAPLFSDIDLPRMREGGLDMVTLAICPHGNKNKVKGSAQAVRRSLDAIHRMLEENQNDLALARTRKEAREIIASGRIAAVIFLEGGHGIEDSLDNLREFYGRGVRGMTVTHLNTHHWAVAAGQDGSVEFDGLSDFGIEVVREMEKTGMMIDLAHASERTFWRVLETTHAPVVVTHAGARALGDHPRNLTDEQIRAVAERRGVIGVIFHAGYLDPTGEKPKDVGLVVDHMDHIKKVAGVEVIALGSDYDGGVEIPPDIGNASRLPALTAELVRRGYTEQEIGMILGENFLRTWEVIQRR